WLTTRAGRKVAFGPLRLVAGRRALGRLASRLPGRWLALAAAVAQTANGGPLPTAVDPPGRARGTAALLTGCVAESVFPATNLATARLLAHAGVRVLVPPRQGCCGALALHLGAAARARALARKAARELAATGADWVVSNAAGCGAALRDYDHLLPEDPHAVSVARRARDALELLAELGLPPPGRRLAARVAVHDPCHLAHGQGVRVAPRALLAAIPGVRLVELEEADTCCGSAGTYNLTEPAMADRLLARKIERIAASGADVVAADNPGCLLQIRAGVIARGIHVAVLQRDQRRLGGALLAEDVEQRRLDVAGRDGVHEDALAANFACQGLREGDDPALRRRVVRGAGDAGRRGDARHVDDPPAAPGSHERERRPRAEEGAREMHREHALPALVGEPRGRLERRRHPAAGHELLHLPREPRLRLGVRIRVAGVVDQDVEAAARGFGEALEPAPHGPRVGDVADERATGERGVERAQLGVDLGGRRGAEVAHRDARPGAREAERDLPAEPRAGAGDERDLAVELSHGSGD